MLFTFLPTIVVHFLTFKCYIANNTFSSVMVVIMIMMMKILGK